ncbi:exonuclease SbcCD subunit D C-terminal domain-containing protein [Psychrobacter urativorans]|uniref:Nuclease SbcCD subunit D n=1 Tax=Psychrobacter urativorans TaxID=45610 RepID=A0A0M4TBB9_9GAMM|nr:exonuclease SbcCD subunit D C-terminal domain-containing protein [Psychrobacter urativorans]ALF58932.1 exodeoxyribonuclease I [Psychrobacter urativorans]
MSVSTAVPLTILHTSDWHLGRRLYGRMRYDEFVTFLNWLADTIATQQVDVLIVAGDIFDTMTPSNRAQALYYEFLGTVSKSCCQHVVIVAGNHDSPTFLDAPSQILKFLNVHVIGTACEDVRDEVLILHDSSDLPYCIIAAVPYLRDRDVRSSGAGESMDSKDANVISGIRAHYDAVAAIAKNHQQVLAKTHARHIPIIATGHLFAAGGSTTTDDGVRDLYVGNLGKISAEMFSPYFDYVALGHLHVPQRVGGREHIRYSGSPIAMGFGEARQQKQVLLVQFGAAADDVAALFNSSTSNPSTLNLPPNNKKTAAQKTANHTAASHNFIDDLFGFDDVDNIEVVQNIGSTVAEVNLLNDDKSQMRVSALPIPCFQPLAQVSGDMQTIKATICTLTQSRSASEPIWLEVVYTGDDIVANLREQIAAMVDGLSCEILKIKNLSTYNKVLNQESASETLQDLNELEVFERCLLVNEVTDAQKLTLRHAYEQIIHEIYDKDHHAE